MRSKHDSDLMSEGPLEGGMRPRPPEPRVRVLLSRISRDTIA